MIEELSKKPGFADIIDKIKEESGSGMQVPGQRMIKELGKKSEFTDIIDKVKEKSEQKLILREMKEADEKSRPAI